MLLDQLISIIAPFNCLVCGQEGTVVCTACLPKAASAKRSSCFMCNKLTVGWRVCDACRRKTQVRGVFVASHYEGHVKTMVRMLKYKQAAAVSKTLATLLVPVIDLGVGIDVVTAVPASSKRFRQRGYNQAKLIGRALAKQLQLPFVESLGRSGHARQVGTSRQQRLKQATDTMYGLGNLRLKDQRVLVVDDVVTTGATMMEAGRALKSAGAKYVWGAAVAKH